MSHSFYNSPEYRQKQSVITRENWKRGVFDFHWKRETRVCARKECDQKFKVKLSSPKIYCSSSCAAKVNNALRGPCPEEQRLKISRALKGRRNPHKGEIKVPRVWVVCANPNCKKIFIKERYMKKRYCCNKCAMEVIGARPTSPKAARGKSGIREDIDKSTYFYSRWEANFARLLILLNIEWIHQPEAFDLISQKYTPDFYLPEYDMYIEIKNFLGQYSRLRHKKFNKLYPEKDLILVLKKDYLILENKYADLIENWEYRNS